MTADMINRAPGGYGNRGTQEYPSCSRVARHRAPDVRAGIACRPKRAGVMSLRRREPDMARSDRVERQGQTMVRFFGDHRTVACGTAVPHRCLHPGFRNRWIGCGFRLLC